MKLLRLTSLTLVVLAALPAWATTARRVELPELVRGAELIVLATPTSASAYWVGGRIFTRTRMRVTEVWHGSADATLDVLTLGGVVDTIGQRVDGEAFFPEHTPVVLFLVRDAKQSGYRVLAMAQGAHLVMPDASRADAGRRDELAGRLGDVRVVSVPLPTFKAQVQELLRER